MHVWASRSSIVYWNAPESHALLIPRISLLLWCAIIERPRKNWITVNVAPSDYVLATPLRIVMNQKILLFFLQALLLVSLLPRSIVNNLQNPQSLSLFHAFQITSVVIDDGITVVLPLTMRTRLQTMGFNQRRSILLFPLEDEEEWTLKDRNNTYVDW